MGLGEGERPFDSSRLALVRRWNEEAWPVRREKAWTHASEDAVANAAGDARADDHRKRLELVGPSAGEGSEPWRRKRGGGELAPSERQQSRAGHRVIALT